jgi:hypothetical protein
MGHAIGGGSEAKYDKARSDVRRPLGEGGQVALESLFGDPEAEVAPDYGVEYRRHTGEPVPGQIGQVILAWPKPPDPAIGFLDGTFPPRAVWIAEIDLGAELCGEKSISGELGVTDRG